VFDNKGITIKEVVEARKQKIAGDDAWKLIASAREVIVGKGKKFHVFDPSADSREDILKAALGRTGNLRAPALKMGDRLVIGYNEDMYKQYIG